MSNTNDYRNTEYCPQKDRIQQKKIVLEQMIKDESPYTKIMYNKIRNREDKYHKLFARIYNGKCGYCGCAWPLLPTESFEIDHFINEASYPKTLAGRIEAGKTSNLVWACVSCNRGKSGLTISGKYEEILHPDLDEIASVFERDNQYYIQISEKYKDDVFINKFYEELRLGYEVRRLDYLLLELNGKMQREEDQTKKEKLGYALSVLLKKRNETTIYQERVS